MDLKVSDRSRPDEYSGQAKELYVNTPEYMEMAEKQKHRTEEEKKILADRFMLLFKEAGEIKDMDPASSEVQDFVKTIREYITENFYTCTDKILKALGRMYSGGGDFTKNIDEYGGDGTAEFADKAIRNSIPERRSVSLRHASSFVFVKYMISKI